MTCIVGLVADGKVLIGGDSAGVSGWDLDVRADSKVFRNADFLFGFTSSFRMGQLLRYQLTIPKREDKDVMAFMVTYFIDAVRDCLKAGGLAKKESEVESGGAFIVGYAGRLFLIESDYQVAESTSAYAACGCGKSFALGVFYATQDMEPAKRIELALRAAEANSAGVRGPFHIETI